MHDVPVFLFFGLCVTLTLLFLLQWARGSPPAAAEGFLEGLRGGDDHRIARPARQRIGIVKPGRPRRKGGEVGRDVELARHEFAQAKLMVRAFDRAHALKLVNAGVDVQVRETFESAVQFGAAVLRELGVPEEDADAIATQVRRLDAERFELETASNDTRAGIPLIIKNTNTPGPKPTPLTRPRRESRVLNDASASTPGPGSSAP